MQWGLNCYQPSGDEAVPGCSGSSLNTCIDPDPGTLVLMGDDGYPAESFPLGVCEGDCDFDSDCEVGALSFVLTVISSPPRRCDHLTFLLLFMHFVRDLLFVINETILRMYLVVSDQGAPLMTTATILEIHLWSRVQILNSLSLATMATHLIISLLGNAKATVTTQMNVRYVNASGYSAGFVDGILT
jgi:hypothetical protein